MSDLGSDQSWSFQHVDLLVVPGDDEEDALTSRLFDELNSSPEHNDKFVTVLFMSCREEELSSVAWVIHNAFLDLLLDCPEGIECLDLV